MPHLYTWRDCTNLDINETQQLYRQFVSSSQVRLISSFGFGRVIAVRSEGMYIYTADGRKILDFTGGVGVLHHGHNHPRLLATRTDFQASQRMEVHKNFLSQYVAGLSHNIAQLLPENLDITYLCNSGAEAVEGAVKLAYKYFDGNRKHVLHSDISFHGKLLGAASLTGSPELNYEFPKIPHTKSFEYGNIDSVREAVTKLRKTDGTSDVYSLLLEPFSASSLRACSEKFLTELRKLCTEEGIILIFDEVYTGWGKTGELFYFMKSNVVPDIVTMSKSMGGGKASISAYTARTPLFEKAYNNLSDATLHSTTYNGFGEECATAIEAINIVVEDNYVARSKRIYERLHKGLVALQTKYPKLITSVRGAGSLNGVIINDDINPALKSVISMVPIKLFKDKQFVSKLVTSAVISELFNTHSILTFFGSNREIPLIVSPSLIASDEEIDRFLAAFDKTLSLGRVKLVARFMAQRFTNQI